MQLSGIGDTHTADVHQVTKCLHDHAQPKNGGVKMLVPPTETSSQSIREQQGQSELTLTDWLQLLFRSGKERWIGFWRGNEYPSEGKAGDKTGTSQVMAQINDTTVMKEERTIHNNPYFAAVPTVSIEQPQNAALSIPQRIRLKCRSVAGQLAKQLPRRFFQFQKRGSFQAKKEGNREDLRKRSKYREDELEIDCILTDESYLLDSYDRKGEYSQLTTKK